MNASDRHTKSVRISTSVLSASEKLATKTRSSWLNCALRDDEAVYWVSNTDTMEAVAVGD